MVAQAFENGGGREMVKRAMNSKFNTVFYACILSVLYSEAIASRCSDKKGRRSRSRGESDERT